MRCLCQATAIARLYIIPRHYRLGRLLYTCLPDFRANRFTADTAYWGLRYTVHEVLPRYYLFFAHRCHRQFCARLVQLCTGVGMIKTVVPYQALANWRHMLDKTLHKIDHSERQIFSSTSLMRLLVPAELVRCIYLLEVTLLRCLNSDL